LLRLGADPDQLPTSMEAAAGLQINDEADDAL
jgi:hypothetical protein